jgi:hypothetical protein
MQQLAQGIASLGRGEDKMLVHMTPGEVSGLQSLALKHGGSLTINPQTGLPEAGFLSSILPMVAGAVGTAFGGPMGGMIAGGMAGAMTNEKNPLMGGLMGGISGYGMAGLGETFAGMGAGAEATAAAAGSELTGAFDPRLGELGINTAMPPATPFNSANALGAAEMQQFPPSGGDMWGPSSQSMSGNAASPITEGTQHAPPPAATATAPAPNAIPGATPGGQASVVQNPVNATWEGAKQAAAEPWKFASNPAGKYKNAKNLAMAGAPLLMGLGAMGGKQGAVPGKNPEQYYHTTYNPGSKNPRFGEPGQPYFLGQGYGPGSYSTAYAGGGDVARPYRGGDGEAPRYSREINSDAPGGGPASDDPGAGINKNTDSGLTSLFAKVSPATLERYAKGAKNSAHQAAALRELYSRNNAVDTVSAAEGGLMGGSKPDENQFYPGANIASSSQNPTSTEVVGGYDPSVNTYTGEPRKMAEGGFASPDGSTSVGIPEAIFNRGGTFNPGMPPPSGGGLAGLLASQGNPEGRSQYSYTPVQQTFQKWTPPAPAAPTPVASNYSWNGGKYADEAALRGALGTYATQNNYTPASVDTWMGDQTKYGISSTPTPTPVAAAPVDGGAGTYVYDPKTQQYTYTAPAAPVAATPVDATPVDAFLPEPQYFDPGGFAGGGLASLDTYAAGGKLLHGPGDGMSDSIPAVIQGAKPQRAALAQGEFVIPADVVSHLGNGSTNAGSKRLYAMMDKVRHARTGNKKQGKQINADRFLPA